MQENDGKDGDHNPAKVPPQIMLETGGHMAQIRAVAFTPGGRCLISAGDDKTIRIWTLDDGRSARLLRGEIDVGPKGTIYALALSPDGRLLAAAGSMEMPEGGQHAIRLYDLLTGEISGLLVGHTDVVTSLAFSPDGQLLVSGSRDKTAILWDVDGRAKVQTLKGHTDGVISVAMTPDGERVITASLDATARLWDPADGRQIIEMKGHGTPITAMTVVARDAGSLIATASRDGVVKLWRATDGGLHKTLIELEFTPGALAAVPGGLALVVTCGDRCKRAFEQRAVSVETGEVIATQHDHDGFVFAAAVNQDGLVATAGGTGHEIQLWRIDTAITQQVLRGTGRAVSATGFYPDGKMLAWSTTFSEQSHLVRGPFQLSINLPDDDTHLSEIFAVPAEASASFVHAEDRSGDWSISHASAARSGGRAAGAGGGGGEGGSTGPGSAVIEIRHNDETAARIEPHYPTATGFAYRAYGFAASGKEVMVGGDDGLLETHTLKGELATAFVGHQSTVWALAPSPDGRIVASGGSDQTVKLWNASTGELIVTLYVGIDGEWVMWTPQGFYIGSPGGGELIGWQVDRGPDKAAEYVRGQQLREYLNRPDIVERAIVLASAKAAVGELSPNTPTPEQILSLGRPPVVALLDGDLEAASGHGVIIVGLNENELPVESIDVWVNDRKVTTRAVDLPATVGTRAGIGYTAIQVPLFTNDNVVRVIATNEVGSSDQSDHALSIKIFHRGEGALDKRGTLFVLAVGVDRYPGLPQQCSGPGGSCDLRFAGRDADGFMTTAEKEMAAAHEHVVPIVLANGKGADHEPTKANIEAALKRLETEAGANDTVAFFFAGHGTNRRGSFYFLPTDAADGDDARAGNFLDWGIVQRAINNVNGRRLLFIDTCHAANSYNQRLLEEARVNRFFAFAAAKGEQSALEEPTLEHGQFTYALIKGLTGEAQDKVDNAVYVYDLARTFRRRWAGVLIGGRRDQRLRVGDRHRQVGGVRHGNRAAGRIVGDHERSAAHGHRAGLDGCAIQSDIDARCAANVNVLGQAIRDANHVDVQQGDIGAVDIADQDVSVRNQHWHAANRMTGVDAAIVRPALRIAGIEVQQRRIVHRHDVNGGDRRAGDEASGVGSGEGERAVHRGRIVGCIFVGDACNERVEVGLSHGNCSAGAVGDGERLVGGVISDRDGRTAHDRGLRAGGGEVPWRV